MTRPGPTEEPDAPDSVATPGLEDPREIHPAPEGIFNEPARSPGELPEPGADPPSFPGDARFVLDARKTTDGFGRYLNHSKEEFNCVAVPEDEYWRVWRGQGLPPHRSHDRMFIVAEKDTETGAELLLNYGCGYQF